jgi:CubicO group peptidase (beta-lactamase class C family)
MAITHRGNSLALKAFGRFTYEPASPAVTPTTLFDLASVTKIVATTSMAMLLYERGLLDLDAPVDAIVPEFLQAVSDARRHNVTLRMLLAHSSGLPAYEKLFLKAHTRDELLQAAFATPLASNPGSRADYSDIGFILLGVALERIADESLDRFCQRELFAPLGMINTTFNPPKEIRAQIPPTTDDRSFRHRLIQGEVQDENASVLGGVAGHAGVFSTAADLARFAHAILNAGRTVLRNLKPSPYSRGANPCPQAHRVRSDGTHLLRLAIGKLFPPDILRPSWLYGNVAMGRPRPATVDYFANQPNLALTAPMMQSNKSVPDFMTLLLKRWKGLLSTCGCMSFRIARCG